MKKKLYVNQFKRHRLTTKGLKDLPLTQQRFEELWIKLEKIGCNNYEKEQCLNKLKEACAWFTRGVALLNAESDEEVKTSTKK
jgi:hypothetical protein